MLVWKCCYTVKLTKILVLNKKLTKEVVWLVKVKQASHWQLWRLSAQCVHVCLVKLLGNNSGIFQYIELAEFCVHSRRIIHSFQMIGEFLKTEFCLQK